MTDANAAAGSAVIDRIYELLPGLEAEVRFLKSQPRGEKVDVYSVAAIFDAVQ